MHHVETYVVYRAVFCSAQETCTRKKSVAVAKKVDRTALLRRRAYALTAELSRRLYAVAVTFLYCLQYTPMRLSQPIYSVSFSSGVMDLSV